MKPFLLSLAALCLFASVSAADHIFYGTVAINWDQCYGDGSISNKIFACDTNTGSDAMVVSVTPSADTPGVVACAFEIDLTSSGSTIPDWWNFDNSLTYGPLGCRAATGRVASAMTASFSFPPSAHCVDAWAGQASGGSNFNYYITWGRMRAVCAVANPIVTTPGQELMVGSIVISHVKTAGAGACTGCAVPMCIVLDRVELDANSLAYPMFFPHDGTDSDLLTWQPGVTVQRSLVPDCNSIYPTLPCNKDFQCLAVTPARRPTWGAIKAIYH